MLKISSCEHKDTNNCTCLYCAGNHKSQNCSYKTSHDKSILKCSICNISTSVSSTSSEIGHPANSPNCPLLLKEVKLLLSRTINQRNTFAGIPTIKSSHLCAGTGRAASLCAAVLMAPFSHGRFGRRPADQPAVSFPIRNPTLNIY